MRRERRKHQKSNFYRVRLSFILSAFSPLSAVRFFYFSPATELSPPFPSSNRTMEMVLPRAAPLLRAQSAPRTSDEGALVERARAGEVGALDELMNRHRARILNLAYQITRDRDIAEDCAQEAFVRAFSKLTMFRAQSSFATWLTRIALNVALEKQRGSPTIRSLDDEDLQREVRAPPTDFEGRLALEWALDQLSPTLRISLILREWHGLTYEEIASVCEVPVGTVRSRLSAARIEFRRVWSGMEKE